MLTELRIDNFAIIQRLELEFGPGLTTFTGETGAGKSILLDALISVVGGRTDPTFIRSGAERASVEATFRIPEPNRAAVHELLTREDLLDDPDYVTLGRELRKEGRSVARVNGRSVSVSLLKEIGSYLVDIHGQSEHLSLLNVRQHLGLLDRFTNTAPALDAYKKVYRELLDIRRQLNHLRQNEQDAARRTDFLTFQIQEIESAHLLPGEEEELRKERDRLANAESLADLAQQSLLLLDEGTVESPAISDLLGQVINALASLSRIDPSQAELYQTAEEAAEMIDEVGRDLRLYADQVEFNPRRLEQVEDRLDLINNLKRKYGQLAASAADSKVGAAAADGRVSAEGKAAADSRAVLSAPGAASIESVLRYLEDAREQLDAITHAGERIAELQEQEEQLLKQLAAAAQSLSSMRRQAAETLGRAVETELADLSMNGASFQVEFRLEPDPSGVLLEDGQQVAFDENGIDKVEFLIAPNPGEGLKPLVKIASGGETSRLMLALKNVLARADAIPTLVFDEIDQGIGGRVGAVVGEKLWQLARQHQVLCVTHLPQLAAFGDQHMRVQKHVQAGRTTTQVEALGDAIRLDELALMIGSVTDANRNAARESLEWARRRSGELVKAK